MINTKYKFLIKIIHIILVIILCSSLFTTNKVIKNFTTFMCSFLLVKWITNYHKCTLGFLECKIRGIPRKEGVINNILNSLLNLNKSEYKYIYYTITFIILIINFNK